MSPEETQQETQQEYAAPESEVPEHPSGMLGKDDNTVFVGRKPAMSYVTAIVTRFNNGAEEVKVKARGKSISCAVDSTQIVKHKFFPTLKIGNVVIETEELTGEDGRTSRVSSMTLYLTK